MIVSLMTSSDKFTSTSSCCKYQDILSFEFDSYLFVGKYRLID